MDGGYDDETDDESEAERCAAAAAGGGGAIVTAIDSTYVQTLPQNSTTLLQPGS